jgi:dTDP-4-amino-4,6-dideoxygalactose transaminase
MGSEEMGFVQQAFATNWIASVGPNVDAFEREFCQPLGPGFKATAVASGTAALHLALQLVGVGPGDEVLCSSLTFVASANPAVYLGAKPVFIDCERTSWNLDPSVLEEALETMVREGRKPKALVLVHLYGQSADIAPIADLCERYGVALVEDAAEALGATYRNRPVGTFGRVSIFSFNGNKVITTSGGGMVVSPEADLIGKARYLATQARDPVPHYQHSSIGYNYRLSNVLAGIGRGQLRVLEDRIAARRRNFERYQQALADLPGVDFMPEAPWGRSTRWLTCMTIDAAAAGVDRDTVRLALEAENIEARPVWKPLHMQPVFKGCQAFGGAVAEDLFARGLCLPSGSNLSEAELDSVCDTVRRCWR